MLGAGDTQSSLVLPGEGVQQVLLAMVLGYGRGCKVQVRRILPKARMLLRSERNGHARLERGTLRKQQKHMQKLQPGPCAGPFFASVVNR